MYRHAPCLSIRFTCQNRWSELNLAYSTPVVSLFYTVNLCHEQFYYKDWSTRMLNQRTKLTKRVNLPRRRVWANIVAREIPIVQSQANILQPEMLEHSLTGTCNSCTRIYECVVNMYMFIYLSKRRQTFSVSFDKHVCTSHGVYVRMKSCCQWHLSGEHFSFKSFSPALDKFWSNATSC